MTAFRLTLGTVVLLAMPLTASLIYGLASLAGFPVETLALDFSFVVPAFPGIAEPGKSSLRISILNLPHK